MNEASRRLLREILQDPLDIHSIGEEFDPGSDVKQLPEYREKLDTLLKRLEQFGLVERM